MIHQSRSMINMFAVAGAGAAAGHGTLPSFYQHVCSRSARVVAVTATMDNAPKFGMNHSTSLQPKLSNLNNNRVLELENVMAEKLHDDGDDDDGVEKQEEERLNVAKFYGIMEAVGDRMEMHKSIGEQRDNWNNLLLGSVNGITLTASLTTAFAGAIISSTSNNNNSAVFLLALKLSATILYGAATGMMVLMNKLQPSQLAEEQRNAARLFKLLHGELQTFVALGRLTRKTASAEVDEAMEKVLALDRAYPLPLLGSMLDKFPSSVQPAVWWPPQSPRPRKHVNRGYGRNNGWDPKLEERMRRIVEVIKEKDLEDYLRLGNKALMLNKILSVSGPFLTALGAVASTWPCCWGGAYCSAGSNNETDAAMMMTGVVAGALACVVNTVEHGGQVGMVFEMYRGSAGFFKLLEETIVCNLDEPDVDKRENGHLLELKVALSLGRSSSQLHNLASGESASKLF